MKACHALFITTVSALTLALLALEGCGTTIGNGATGTVALSFRAYSVPAALLAPKLNGTISSLSVCIKRLRLRSSDEDSGKSVDLSLDDVNISATGTMVANVAVLNGTYTRAELDLDNHCPSGLTVQVKNLQGTFTSTDSMTIHFKGSVNVSSQNQSLALDIQTLVQALSAVHTTGDIKDLAEAAEGDY